MNTLLQRLAALVSLLYASALWADTATLRIDATKTGPQIHPHLYGIFLEEINHGVDGGLYAELIRNRGFEDARPPEGYTFRNGRWRDARGFDSGFTRYGYVTNGAPFWSVVQEGGAKGAMHLETSGGITEASAYCLRWDVEDVAGGRMGIANQGFFGIGVKQGEAYALSLYARGGDGFTGPLSVRLEDASGAACSDDAKVENIGSGWKQFKATLKASQTDSKTRLVITAESRGKVWLDFVSLTPAKTWKNRPNGLRPDLAQMIADLKPGFVRFPGGCVVEGGTVETAYNWKLTVGPLEQRQERWGPWNYRQTHGMGLYEYLQFIEDLGAEPLWVGFDGQTCIFRERENVPMEEMGWVRDNFLDIVEYANGPASSTWGAQRAQAGHPAPFGLKYVEIGNENQGREYEERYRFVYDAMKVKYPNLTYLADLSWTSRDSMRNAVFDIEDQHYYNSPRWFLSRFNEYDTRERSQPPLYLGEVAVTSQEGGPLRGNLLAALAEGVFLMGCERNADVVRMVSYAPLLGHVEGRTELTGAPPPWHAMIYFDGTRVFGTVSYYLWKLFGVNRPTYTVQTDVAFPSAKPIVVAGQVGVGTWDATAEFKDIRVEKDGQVLYASDFAKGAEGWKPEGGRWNVEDGVYSQGRRGQGLSYFGDENWTDYTLTLKARKLSGGEGFLIVIGRKGTDRYWWNLGGWGNSQHAIEFNQNLVGRPVRGQIETNRWYDIKVEVNGRRIRCSLDNQLVHDATAPSVTRFFAVAGRDAASGDIVLKAINTASESVVASLNITGTERVAPEAELTVLKSDRPNDNNSLDTPAKVTPVTSQITVPGAAFTHEFPPYSFTLIRLKTK
jgi:alpha-L-arabinofuranosidase